jgi:hypothetical protein
MTRLQRLALAYGCAAALIACERVGAGYYGPGTNPSASPTASASASLPPAACASPGASVLIGMSSAFALDQDPQFGELAGYANVTTTEPTQAGVVTATTADTVQFVNLEAATVDHSAVGFPAAGQGASGFPAVPYTFPSAAASPSANTVLGTKYWSTGRIAPAASTDSPCYSQSFSLPAAGTFYFGDLDYYNTITSLRGVIVVTASAQTGRRAAAARSR